MSNGESTSQELSNGDDWPLRAANTVVGYVDKTKQATTGKALVFSRAAVYLLAAGFLAVIVGIVALIALVRLLSSVTAHLSFIDDGEVWLAYYLLTAVFFLVTWFLWRKRGR